MKKNISDLYLRSRIRIFLILIGAIVLTGCVSHIKQLREAQNQFNMAASLENQLKLDSEPKNALLVQTEATASYRVAEKILTQLVEEKKSELQKDNLLSSAYTLKALSEWRLGEYEEAIQTADMAEKGPGAKLFPRDRILIKALRGLIENDQAYCHMQQRDYAYNDIRTLLLDALKNIGGATRLAKKGSRIRLYLVVSQLAVLKNWSDLRGKRNEYATSVPADFNPEAEISEWCKEVKPAWGILVQETKKLDSGIARKLLSVWGRRLAMPGACE